MSSFARLTSHAKLNFEEICCILAAGREDILGRSEQVQMAYREAMAPIRVQYENISDYILISKFNFNAVSSDRDNRGDANGSPSSDGNGNVKLRAQKEDNALSTPQLLCVPNDFPYNYEDNVDSYVIWKYIPPSYKQQRDVDGGQEDNKESIVTEIELQSCIEQLKQDIYNGKCEFLDYCVFESPQHLKSIPDLDHIHLMVKWKEKHEEILEAGITKDYGSNDMEKGEVDFNALLKRIFQHLVIPPSPTGLTRASELLQEGSLVSFPTETVYGLGANALNEEAVISIFTAKGRPLTDPLIVHVATIEHALQLIACGGTNGTKDIVDETEREREREEKALFMYLGERYWPGPLTIIVSASSLIPSAVTAHTGSVGIRIPSNHTAQSLLKACQLPLAAPSANRFGHVSPTRCVHVLSDLAMKGVHVIDDIHEKDGVEKGDIGVTEEVCQHGIESTVVKIDSRERKVLLFRQGAISRAQLERSLRAFHAQYDHGGKSSWALQVVQRTVDMHASEAEKRDESRQKEVTTVGQEAPGQAITHYAPDIPCLVVLPSLSAETATDTLRLSPADLRECVVVVDFHGILLQQLNVSGSDVLGYRDLSDEGDYRTAAKNLFNLLRWSESYKTQGGRYVLIPALHSDKQSGESELQAGVIDRVFRASSGKTVTITVLEE